MSIVECLTSLPFLAGLLVLAAAAFIWNGSRRIAWNRQWKGRSGLMPERMAVYGAHELEAFVNVARSVTVNRQPALAFYAEKVLCGCDIAYAVALAAVTAYAWFRLAVACSPSAADSWIASALVWLAPFFGAMAIAYGVADIAEDLKLASILWPKATASNPDRYPDVIDRADAAAANMLTRIKMMSLGLSLIGYGLFCLLRLAQSGFERALGTKEAQTASEP
jgi:hypothetical protein